MRRALTITLCLAVAALAAPARARGTDAVVRIDMRAPAKAGWFDPKTETVGLRGGTAPLTWSETFKAADPDGDLVYEARIHFDVAPGRDTFVPYKFKVDGAGNPNDGWESGRNRPLFLRRSGEVTTRAFDAAGPDYPHTLHGTVRVHEAFPSTHVAPRTVTVLLPDGYEKSPTRRYPVLYMHDGQNLFDAATSNAGEWRVDESARELERARSIESVIVVGVANAGDQRVNDYTPTPDPQYGGGKADEYGRFLVEELKPFVDRTYRTIPDASHTALGGSSLGGLVTMYLGLEYPNVFGTLLVVSPSVWWGDEMIVKKVRSLDRKTNQKVWLDMGTREGEKAVPQAEELRDALVAKGWRVGVDLAFTVAEGAAHDEAAWAARVPAMLRFAFPIRRRL